MEPNQTSTPPSPQGNRKSKVSLQTTIALLIGFGLACYMQASTELFVAYVIGVSGSSFGFMWGNQQVHKHKNGHKPTP